MREAEFARRRSKTHLSASSSSMALRTDTRSSAPGTRSDKAAAFARQNDCLAEDNAYITRIKPARQVIP